MSNKMTFEQAMELTRTVSSHAAFEDEECAALWDLLQQVPHAGRVVEIGCQYGRSSSLILQAALGGGFTSTHIDPWPHNEYPEWAAMAQKTGAYHTVLKMSSAVAFLAYYDDPIDLLLIDGDHTAHGVEIDWYWTKHIVKGGIVCAHDYGWDSLPDVKEVVDSYVKTGWSHLGTYGTLGVWRKC